jgi:hypothetical protein
MPVLGAGEDSALRPGMRLLQQINIPFTSEGPVFFMV